MKHLGFLSKLSLMTLVTFAVTETNFVYASNKAQDNIIYENRSKAMKETISIGNTDLNTGFGKIVNDAFDENIGIVAETVESNTKKYEKTLVDGKYWARSEKYSESIDNLKKLFTSIWERAGHKGYRKSVIKGFNRQISELQKADEASINRKGNEEGEHNGEEWLESENGRGSFGLVNGLTAFRTLYKFSEKYGGSKPKEKMTLDEVNALFREVFYESKQANKIVGIDRFVKDILVVMKRS